jgi:hypothetical protein
MATVARAWVDEPGFDETADLRTAIATALSKPDPVKALRKAWPWVPAEPRDNLVDAFRNPARAGDAAVLIERFQHTIRAYWADPPPNVSWRVRLLRRWSQ